MSSPITRRAGRVAMAAAVLLAVAAAQGASASTLKPGPGWMLDQPRIHPTNLAPGTEGTIDIFLFNVGGAPSAGTFTVTDTLPAGLTATEAYGAEPSGEDEHSASCSGTTVVTCTNDPSNRPNVLPGGFLRLLIRVKVASTASGTGINTVAVSGGGARLPATVSESILFSASSPGFGFAHFDGWASNPDGTVDTQAGSHPFALTVSLDLNHFPTNELHPRNITVNTPPGLVGDPNATPQCTRQQFDGAMCPSDSQVGIDMAAIGGENGEEPAGYPVFPVYNLVPPPGIPAQFAFTVFGIHTFLDAGVRSGGNYGITEHVNSIDTLHTVTANSITLWGQPSDPAHDEQREGGVNATPKQFCLAHNVTQPTLHERCPPESVSTKPLLTLPTSCRGAHEVTAQVVPWQDPSITGNASFVFHDNNGNPAGATGCERLAQFTPILSLAPDTAGADTPAGLTAEVKVPLGLNPEGLATSGIENTTVVLPPGLVINPGQAAGLTACQPAQEHLGSETDEGPAECPASSKVGTVEIHTPLLTDPIVGNLYVLGSNPPHLQLLLAGSADGVNIKLVGDVRLDEATGQLTTTFSNTPDFPFTDLKLSFSGGPQAALATPTACGVYTVHANFTPWASPFVPDSPFATNFSIASGPAGTGCPSSPLPFAPSMIAGSTTDQAGGFTNFSLLLQRGDGQQRIEKLSFTTPQGFSGMISAVTLCPEPQAQEGSCPASSQIGHAVVASGPGPFPLVIPEPGRPTAPIFLTGPYKGAPFGLSIVVPVITGPFNLGNVITRGAIAVDPHTAQVTVTTDPLPQVVKGVPTDLRTINSVIDKPGFFFNPTNCNPQEFTGTATSAGGAATVPLSSHFGMGSCQSLRFKPRFSVSASGRNSKAGGASLDVKIVYPSEPQGSEANIARVKVDLPRQLPSRLATLQKACTAAQFAANPAGCPSASVVGHAVVHTPVLPVPLEGPAYFVSNGGEAFPNLIMVLQGDGVTVDLVGDTFINKAGITSSTFKATPDVPFSTFELTLPQGPNSALATNVPASAQYSLCGQKLTMPTELVAQNGAVIDRATPVGISGCAKKKSLTRAQKLAAALKACHKQHNHGKRASCERQARKRYGSIGKSKKSKK